MDDLKSKYLTLIADAGDENGLEELRVQALGKKGEISLQMRELGKMTPEERQTAGPALNALKDEINSALVAKKAALADAALDACPGRVYRADYDQTHTPMFNQIEGLAIDKDISMAHLKWVLEEFAAAFFEVDKIEVRFRASHFPFTEPSAEIDFRCSWVDGQLKLGEGDDWLEAGGSGMVHPKVLQNAGIDPAQWQGFAFGLGIDRLAMLKYGIPDLRAFFDSDIRWLKHYGFVPLDVPSVSGGLSK